MTQWQGRIRPADRSAGIGATSAPTGSGSRAGAPAEVPAGSTVADLGEFSLIDAIRATLPQSEHVLVGPGDDAAVVLLAENRVVMSCDMYVAGVHFRTDWSTPEQIGTKAATAALADIYAMGAHPTALVVGMAAPDTTPAETIVAIGGGIAATAAGYGASVVGGDMTSSEQLTISVTVFGDLRGERPIRRSGAQVGDTVAIAGRLGWSAAGFAVLSRGFRSPKALVDAHKVPQPELRAGLAAASAGATAMIDISDGLLADLGHLARASGVTIDVHSTALTVPDRFTEVASAIGTDPMAWVLTGGEDHALAATFPAATALPDPWQPIGTVTGLGVTISDRAAVTVDGEAYAGPQGYSHFAEPRR